MTGREVELKLAVPPSALARLRRLPMLAAYRRGRPAAKMLRATYFDTADGVLAQAGISLRLRTSGRRLIQTVKTDGTRVSGLFSRQEWETVVTGGGLDFAHLAATGLAPLRDAAVRAGLAPVFSTEVRRSILDLAGDGWRVEMAIDTGELRAGAAAETICEAELELREGTPADLFRLARGIAESVPVRLMSLSKSDRGYALAARREAAAVKSRAVELDSTMPVAEAFRVIARNCLHHLLANDAALVGHGDAEAVHQMRVALRRLRSALKIFHPLVQGPQLAALQAEVEWLLSRLGPARDAEVFLAEIIDPVIAARPEARGLAALRHHWVSSHQDDVAAACQAVADRRFTLLLLDFGAWVEAGPWCTDPALPGHDLLDLPVAGFAEDVLDRLARKLRKSAHAKLRRLSPPALHRVRIRGKQLRYAGEFFAALYRRERAKEYLGLLGQLQDRLGEINDLAVAATRLANCHAIGEAAWASGLVQGWHETRRPELMRAAEDLWADWRKRDPFWRT